MSLSELKSKFLEFFRQRGHKVIPSASLVPENDPSVLFTTAGMQQFKRYYLFPDEAPAARVVSIQKCLRTGDIDEVGDESHLTFFEMLGNFSFGYPDKDESYFKQEAIAYAWEFLTEILKIDSSRIHASYFRGEKGLPEDIVSHEILQEVDGLRRIEPQGFSENFWSLGTEGSPGGPTVEFYVDGVEVWNLVLNEFIIRDGKYIESEYKGIDTGLGLERLAAVMQGKTDIYETDLFASIIFKIEEISGKKYRENKKEFRIVADHLRASIALISDGVIPSNKDQGYILRRLIRRVSAKSKQLGIKNNFCAQFSESDEVKNELEKEEEKFRQTLEVGLKKISDKNLFDLYQTYGFPLELSIEELKSRGVEVSNKEIQDFQNSLKEHQEKSRTASAGMFKGGLADNKVETTRLHTAAHLLLAALRRVLGPQVQQKGSNITEERLRFDFNQPEKLTPEQIAKVEKIVNEKIRENLSVVMEEMSLEEAKKSGATGVFDDRYGPKGAPFGGEKVKVYTIKDPSTRATRSGSLETFVSREICGGPHVKNTSELGHFKITKEESSSAGIRRIKAILE